MEESEIKLMRLPAGKNKGTLPLSKAPVGVIDDRISLAFGDHSRAYDEPKTCPW